MARLKHLHQDADRVYSPLPEYAAARRRRSVFDISTTAILPYGRCIGNALQDAASDLFEGRLMDDMVKKTDKPVDEILEHQITELNMEVKKMSAAIKHHIDGDVVRIVTEFL